MGRIQPLISVEVGGLLPQVGNLHGDSIRVPQTHLCAAGAHGQVIGSWAVLDSIGQPALRAGTKYDCNFLSASSSQ